MKTTTFNLVQKKPVRSTGLLGKRSPNGFRVSTPNATIGIRGTHFGLLSCSNDCGSVVGPGGGPPPNGLHVDVADGTIVVTTKVGSVQFGIGQYGYVQSANSLPVVVPESQGVRVTLPTQSLRQNLQGGGGPGEQLECKL